MKKAVCIISGGMDSAVASFMVKKEGYEIVALHFNYGQRTQAKELECFRELVLDLGAIVTYEIDLDFFRQIGMSALVDKNIQVPTGGVDKGVPVTYVPFRNGIFLSIAAAVAEKEGAEAIVIGVVEEDSSGYPDCTEDFISAIEKAINLGTKKETKLAIKTPLVHLRKEDIVLEGLKMGVKFEHTWSCYQNEEQACGVCDSCRLRLKGFKKAKITDPIPYKMSGER